MTTFCVSGAWQTNLLYQELCTLVLYVSLRCGKKCTDSVHSNAALDTHGEKGGGQPGDVTDLDEARAGTLQLIQSIVVSSIHHTWKTVTITKVPSLSRKIPTQQCPWLQGDTPSVDIFYQLPEHIWLKLLDYHCLVLLRRSLSHNMNSFCQLKNEFSLPDLLENDY